MKLSSKLYEFAMRHFWLFAIVIALHNDSNGLAAIFAFLALYFKLDDVLLSKVEKV